MVFASRPANWIQAPRTFSRIWNATVSKVRVATTSGAYAALGVLSAAFSLAGRVAGQNALRLLGSLVGLCQDERRGRAKHSRPQLARLGQCPTA
jgi:hypothetical protein